MSSSVIGTFSWKYLIRCIVKKAYFKDFNMIGEDAIVIFTFVQHYKMLGSCMIFIFSRSPKRPRERRQTTTRMFHFLASMEQGSVLTTTLSFSNVLSQLKSLEGTRRSDRKHSVHTIRCKTSRFPHWPGKSETKPRPPLPLRSTTTSTPRELDRLAQLTASLTNEATSYQSRYERFPESCRRAARTWLLSTAWILTGIWGRSVISTLRWLRRGAGWTWFSCGGYWRLQLIRGWWDTYTRKNLGNSTLTGENLLIVISSSITWRKMFKLLRWYMECVPLWNLRSRYACSNYNWISHFQIENAVL